jgi:NAD(P)-dependent dehydrogenase (short-subunit alcohol dehydrogenase family)
MRSQERAAGIAIVTGAAGGMGAPAARMLAARSKGLKLHGPVSTVPRDRDTVAGFLPQIRQRPSRTR